MGLFNFLMRLAFERFWLFLLLTIIGVPVLLAVFIGFLVVVDVLVSR